METQIPRAEFVKNMLNAAYQAGRDEIRRTQNEIVASALIYEYQRREHKMRTTTSAREIFENRYNFEVFVTLVEGMDPEISLELEKAGYILTLIDDPMHGAKEAKYKIAFADNCY